MNFAIIVAAGKSKRMRNNKNKIFLPLLSKPMVYYALKDFQNCKLIDEIIVVAQKNGIKKINEIKQKYNFGKISNVIVGGEERQDSVYNGSNPLVKENEIINCINAAKKHGAAVLGFQLKDTIKKISNDFIEKTIDRANVYQMQTPQCIKYGSDRK